MARNRNTRKPEPGPVPAKVLVDDEDRGLVGASGTPQKIADALPDAVPVPEPEVAIPPPARCGNCPYWVFAADDKARGPVGECRRFPPAIVDPSLLTLSGPLVRFGLTSADTSCGEHPRTPSPAR